MKFYEELSLENEEWQRRRALRPNSLSDPGADPADEWDFPRTLADLDDEADEAHHLKAAAAQPRRFTADPVNHPDHYTGFSNGAEVIDITEHLTLNRGSAVKYLARAGRKDAAKELEDLRKARWYVDREIGRLGG